METDLEILEKFKEIFFLKTLNEAHDLLCGFAFDGDDEALEQYTWEACQNEGEYTMPEEMKEYALVCFEDDELEDDDGFSVVEE